MYDILTYQVQGVHTPKTKAGFSKMLSLLEAADKLFNETGYFDVSISDICKQSHTAVGTFYIYFDGKIDIYRYLMEIYKHQIKRLLAESIEGCQTRAQREREGIKCFIRYAVKNPNVYNIIWGSLAVEKQMFEDYYVSFAESYAKALRNDKQELSSADVTSMAYMLMGITNFLGLRAIFEDMSDDQINAIIDQSIMPILESGMFRQAEPSAL